MDWIVGSRCHTPHHWDVRSSRPALVPVRRDPELKGEVRQSPIPPPGRKDHHSQQQRSLGCVGGFLHGQQKKGGQGCWSQAFFLANGNQLLQHCSPCSSNFASIKSCLAFLQIDQFPKRAKVSIRAEWAWCHSKTCVTDGVGIGSVEEENGGTSAILINL